eukprot:7393782-Pyramimonas_sp.AAC.1
MAFRFEGPDGPFPLCQLLAARQAMIDEPDMAETILKCAEKVWIDVPALQVYKPRDFVWVAKPARVNAWETLTNFHFSLGRNPNIPTATLQHSVFNIVWFDGHGAPRQWPHTFLIN